MDQTHINQNVNITEIKTENTTFEIGKQRTVTEQDTKMRTTFDEELTHDEERYDTDTNVQIEEVATTRQHRFAPKTSMKYKAAASKSEAEIEEDPFASLASCMRMTSSKEMKRVKDALTKIERLMDRTITRSEKDFKLEQTRIVAAYNEVIAHCKSYLDVRGGKRKTENGRMRQLMVGQILARCTEELKLFEETSANVFREIQDGENKQWIDVLSEIRSETIDMDMEGREVTKGGEGTSEILICNIENERKYFKEKEDFENIESNKLAYREMENAPEGSIEKKIKDYLDANQDMKDQFEFMVNSLDGLSDMDLWFPSEIDENSFVKVKERYSSQIFLEEKGGFMDSICTDAESTKSFVDFALKLKKNNTKCYVANVMAKIKSGEVLSNRNVATSRVANLFGVPELIAGSKNVTLKYQGKSIQGNMMDEAKGVGYGQLLADAEKEEAHIQMAPEALRQIYTLQLLDYLCGQVDRNRANFLCVVDKNGKNWEVKQITGIDNDMAFGELKLDLKDSRPIQQLPPIVDQNGVFSIPAIDYRISNRLAGTTGEELKFALMDLLGEGALKALESRLNVLKKVVKDAVKKGKTEIIPSENLDTNEDFQNLWRKAYQTRPSYYSRPD